MNKFLVLGVIGALFALSPMFAFADASTTPVGNGDPNMVQQAWGTNGYNTPHMAAGSTVVDEFGLKSQCPSFFAVSSAFPSGQECFNLTQTSYYINTMVNAGFKSLK